MNHLGYKVFEELKNNVFLKLYVLPSVSTYFGCGEHERRILVSLFQAIASSIKKDALEVSNLYH